MRGRTNIPPRVGGIVTGDVVEYQVAEQGGIDIGNYVELIVNNTSTQSVDLSSPYSPPSDVYKLSNGSFILFGTWTNSLLLDMFKVDGSGINNTQTVTVDLSGTSFVYSNNQRMWSIELSTDNFLVAIDCNNTIIFIKLVFDGVSFYASQVGTYAIYETRYTTTKEYFTKQNILKWDDSHFIMALNKTSNSTRNLVLFEISGNSISVVDESISVSGSYNYLFKIGNKLVYCYGSGVQPKVNVYSVDVNNGVVLSYSFTMDSSVSAGNIFPIGSNYLLAWGKSNWKGKVITIGENSYSISDPQDLSISVRSVNLNMGVVLKNGKLMLTATDGYSIIVGYNEDLGSVTLGTPFLLKSNVSEYQQPLEVRDDSNRFILNYHTYNSSSGRYLDTVLSVYKEQNILVPTEVVPQVTKYKSVINGIAKTPGSYGEKIEVYIPQ